MSEILVYVDEFLPMIQTVASRPFGASASDFIAFKQTTKVSPIRVAVTQPLKLLESFSVRTSIKNVSASDGLAMWGSAAKGPYAQVIDLFFAWQSARKVLWDGPTVQQLKFIESILGVNTKGAISTFLPTDLATWKLVRSRTVSQILGLQGFAQAYKLDTNFVAIGGITLTDPRQLVLSWSGLTVTLRDPDFGDVHGVEISRINRKTRGGDLQIFRDPMWPKTRTLRYTFSFLSEKQKSDLLYFLYASMGQQIALVDYEGITWNGVIRTPVGNVVEQGRFNYTAEFEFEGDPA